MKQIVDTDWWEPVLNTYVEPTKRALVERMRDGSGRAPHNNEKRKPYNNWLFDSHGDVFNGYIREGFEWKEVLRQTYDVFGKPQYDGPEEAFKAAEANKTSNGFTRDAETNTFTSEVVYEPNEGHIGTKKGKVDYDLAKAAFDAKDPKIIINADRTWLSVTNAEKQVDVWNRKLKP
jgi:hypothetical protein